ncbi:2-oxoglutarate dehydrogenase E1 component [Buchnera aphidicola (Ceratoglyphina bambusae)]|uniref:2-oxoglutarate dehydrogenase E1 component n=1 Tax=Buchnera aphidicola TaxID=9 RepID=UPI0031B83ADC
MKNKKKFNKYLNAYNQNYIENLFIRFLKNKNNVNKDWRVFFSNIKEKENIKKNKNYNNIKEKYEIKILKNYFRKNGHIISKINPIKKNKNYNNKNLKFYLYKKKYYKIKKKIKENNITVEKNEINYINNYKKFKKIYTEKIGIEYIHISNKKEKLWIQNYLEKKNNNKLCRKYKIKLLKNLIISSYFEKYLNIKFPGAKRFSLEGSDILIPVLKEIIRYSKKNKLKKIILGMAHRGRLNVLRNIFKKKMSEIFNEFNDININKKKIDDVKYHMGFNRKIIKENKSINIEIKYNPSHLESICPVVLGSTRYYLDKFKKKNKILSVLVHGDASLSGQGIIQETLNMSKTKGFTVNGTIHIVINNQIGFTSNYKELRSNKYCTDIAKMIESPVFHVNADFPEESIFIINLALKFLKKFKKDVFIDIISYRRHGHHESDDPTITQPKMYKFIKNHDPVYKIYGKKLINENIIYKNKIKKIKKEYTNFLKNEELNYTKNKNNFYLNNYDKRKIKKKNKNKIKIISFEEFKNLALKINTIPKYIKIHPIVKKIYYNRIKMSKGEKKLDWSAAEALSIANLLHSGISCRISGQDVSRGTFSQRHAIIYDQNNESSYIPLCNVNKNSKFYIWNSTLSESSILAFEYGYSTSSKKMINIWEAQFGDFSNSSQVIIDQFISSGKKKWNKKSNLIILLPHGYEGQGPEHSSARLERFLQLSSENNMKIVVPSTSSQIYHIINNQIYTKNISPLIIMSPKSMLRNSKSFTSLKDIYFGKFKKIIYKKNNINKKIKKIIICSGKIYYDLYKEIKAKNINNVLIIRIEILYPFPKKDLYKVIRLYKNINKYIWCQEEPKNQGAWNFIKNYIIKIIPKNKKIKCISRPSSSSTATSFMKTHIKQQKKIIINSLY